MVSLATIHPLERTLTETPLLELLLCSLEPCFLYIKIPQAEACLLEWIWAQTWKVAQNSIPTFSQDALLKPNQITTLDARIQAYI